MRDGTPKVILYVDDRPELPAGLPKRLEADGYELVQTGDAETAVRLAREREPALVMIEVDLADCDGLDLLEGLRAPRPDGDAPAILVLSRASRSSGLYGEVIALGVTNFLDKPTLLPELLSAIHELAPPPPKPAPPEPEGHSEAQEFAGDLSDAPLPELLSRLRRRGASGVLIANQGRAQVGVQVRNGSPVSVSTNLKRAAESDAPAEAALMEGFAWTRGSYRLAEGKRLKAEAAHDLPGDPERMILRCVQAASPVEVVRDRLRKRAALYACACPEEYARVEDMGLDAEQQHQLAALGGESTLERILDSGVFEERLLYGLWVAGWLELHSAPTLNLLEVLGAEDEVAPSPAPDSPEDLVQRVRALTQRVMAADDFEALDIPTFAPDGQVRTAYERTLAEIPQAALDSSDAELRSQAHRIRRRVEAAYDHLKDAETRRAHALLRQEEAQDRDARTSAPRALEAERWFRKGTGLLTGKRHPEAAEAFGMASHLDPDEGEYLAHLGYALYLANPQDDVVRREAMQHITNGIKRSPDRELPYVYLARVLAAKGETDTARKVLNRALRIKPGCVPAQRELRLLEMRRRKGFGWIKRLFGR